VPDIPQHISLPNLNEATLPIIEQWGNSLTQQLIRVWTSVVQTLNALSRVDTAANKLTTPLLDHVFFTESDTGITYIAVAGAWQVVTGNSGTLRTTAITTTTMATDSIILADATSGALTIDLLTAVGRTGRVYGVKKIDASANAVTVDPAGGETIDGATTKVLSTQYASVTFVSNNANWFII